ncbi:transcriptional activator of glycolytic enzymes-domain-containing protein [Lipomyces japonicus]|uniref:transcriptional activator of glycolytic enzymes-domain-containing protein n=1 Tax=Lipomyces japonicus TaxID=56871 RepID=UPI0034CF83D6
MAHPSDQRIPLAVLAANNGVDGQQSGGSVTAATAAAAAAAAAAFSRPATDALLQMRSAMDDMRTEMRSESGMIRAMESQLRLVCDEIMHIRQSQDDQRAAVISLAQSVQSSVQDMRALIEREFANVRREIRQEAELIRRQNRVEANNAADNARQSVQRTAEFARDLEIISEVANRAYSRASQLRAESDRSGMAHEDLHTQQQQSDATISNMQRHHGGQQSSPSASATQFLPQLQAPGHDHDDNNLHHQQQQQQETTNRQQHLQPSQSQYSAEQQFTPQSPAPSLIPHHHYNHPSSLSFQVPQFGNFADAQGMIARNNSAISTTANDNTGMTHHGPTIPLPYTRGQSLSDFRSQAPPLPPQAPPQSSQLLQSPSGMPADTTNNNNNHNDNDNNNVNNNNTTNNPTPPPPPPTTTTTNNNNNNNNNNGSSDEESNYIHVMASNLNSVRDIWLEYAQGLNGGPNLKDLEKLHGTVWRGGPRSAQSRKFQRRRLLYETIERGMTSGRSLDECCAVLEQLRYKNDGSKRSLTWLLQHIPLDLFN